MIIMLPRNIKALYQFIHPRQERGGEDWLLQNCCSYAQILLLGDRGGKKGDEKVEFRQDQSFRKDGSMCFQTFLEQFHTSLRRTN